jgi:uncharacterized protein YkwD
VSWRRRLAALLLLSGAACAARQGAPGDLPAALPPPTSGSPCGEYGLDRPGPRTALEARAWEEVQRALRGTGTRLQPSGALDRAARALAVAAARERADPLARRRIQDALRVAGAFDPSPTAHLAVGTPDALLAALLARLDRNDSTHVGIGDHEDARGHHLVLLQSRRRARLDRFPGAVAEGAERTLRGDLQGLLQPRAFVTRPDGVSEELGLGGGRAFSGRIRFSLPGRHSVEVIGTGERGPEVAALLGVSVGGARCADTPPALPAAEPETLEGAEAAVADAVNRVRRTGGLKALELSPGLSAVARHHSEQMLAANTVAHVLPGDGDLAARLAAARIPYHRAFENVSSGESALEAHAAAEGSPAHRSGMLAPEATRLGIGIARGALPTGERIVYLTEILLEPPADLVADRLTPDARAREALWGERARRSLPPLTSDPALEALAREAALAMRARDRGEVGGLAEGALRLGRALAAADTFIASSPAEAVRSQNVTDPRFRRVGVWIAAGDSRRFGPARLYIAVVYSD